LQYHDIIILRRHSSRPFVGILVHSFISKIKLQHALNLRTTQIKLGTCVFLDEIPFALSITKVWHFAVILFLDFWRYDPDFVLQENSFVSLNQG